MSIFNHSDDSTETFERLQNNFLGIQPSTTLCLGNQCTFNFEFNEDFIGFLDN